MTQFFSSTLASKYIKYLLMNTYLPNCSYAYDGEYIVKGATYLINNSIVECTKSGYLSYAPSEEVPVITGDDECVIFDEEKHTQTIGQIMCGIWVKDAYTNKVGEIRCGMLMRKELYSLAEYEPIIDYDFGQNIHGNTDNFISTYSYYDSNTHEKLGDYLRCIKSIYSLDLMPLYNCFSNLFVQNIDLTSSKLRENVNSLYKTTLIPIKYNKKYNVYIDCATPIYICPVLYRDGLLRASDNSILHPKLGGEVRKINRISYSYPLKYSLHCELLDDYMLEKYLYLAIQIPVGNKSPITVIEGDYQYVGQNIDMISNLDSNTHLTSIPSLTVNKLLHPDYDISKPFSDKLLGYLLGNTIDMRDPITSNIDRINEAADIPNAYGEWSLKLRKKLFSDYMGLKDKFVDLNFYDILGYVDRDVEKAMSMGLIYPNGTI